MSDNNEKDLKLHTGHRKRMKERFMRSGPEGFADHELIEMLLYNTYARKDTNELAHKLLNEYNNSLSMLVEADPADLMFRCGLNDNTAVFFSIMREINRRYNGERYKKKLTLDSSVVSGEYALYLMENEKRECFYTICLDSQSRLISAVPISKGDITETSIYVRNVVEAAIKYNAVSVIFAHNHPSGSTRPSGSDVSTTIDLIKILNAMKIIVADHIIVADGKYYSMADNGLIKNKIV